MAGKEEDHYTVLELSRDSTENDIKKNFQRLIRKVSRKGMLSVDQMWWLLCCRFILTNFLRSLASMKGMPQLNSTTKSLWPTAPSPTARND